MEHPKRAMCDRGEVVSGEHLDYHGELRMPKFAHAIGATDNLESEHVAAQHAHMKLLGDDSHAQFFTDAKGMFCMVFGASNDHEIERLAKFLKDCKNKYSLEAFQGPDYPDEAKDEPMKFGHHIRISKPFVFVVRVPPLHSSPDVPVHDSGEYWKRRE